MMSSAPKPALTSYEFELISRRAARLSNTHRTSQYDELAVWAVVTSGVGATTQCPATGRFVDAVLASLPASQAGFLLAERAAKEGLRTQIGHILSSDASMKLLRTDVHVKGVSAPNAPPLVGFRRPPAGAPGVIQAVPLVLRVRCPRLRDLATSVRACTTRRLPPVTTSKPVPRGFLSS